MNLQRYSEHTLDSDRLRGGWVLDAGCRGFDFARAVAIAGCKVLAIDAGPDVEDFSPSIEGVIFDCVALTAPGPRVRQFFDGGGNASHLWREGDAAGVPVPCTTIRELMARYDIKRFDAIKLDVEGEEYAILAAWPGDVTRQISVEFHDFIGLNPRPSTPESWYAETFARLDSLYTVAQHEALPMHGAGVNYWDTLLVDRREELRAKATRPPGEMLGEMCDRVTNIEFMLRDLAKIDFTLRNMECKWKRNIRDLIVGIDRFAKRQAGKDQ